LITLGALVRVPIPGTDVPMTLQLLAVLVTGFVLTPRRAVAATLAYLGCGVAGLPVFASTAGLAGPTAGYLAGFVLAAWLVAVLKGARSPHAARLMLAGAAGVLVVFVLGVAWRLVLARLAGLGGGDCAVVVMTGLAPFAGKAVVELLLAVTIAVSVVRLKVGLGGRPGRDG
jgi:biotin transport system substrate-specific component